MAIVRERFVCGILIGFVVSATALCQQQTAALPSFETMAIHPVSHPSPNENHSVVTLVDAHRFRAVNADVSELIEWAYDVRADRISGPADIKSKIFTFDIEAVLPEQADRAQAKLMLRRLLSERFAVTLHSVVKPTSGYFLVVDRGGPKLKISESAGAGGVSARGGSTSIQLVATAITMGNLANALSRNTEVPVIDQTHLDGLYDIDIRFSRMGPVDSDAPTIFEVIRRLGLRLDKADIPVESILVDHVNLKPTEN